MKNNCEEVIRIEIDADDQIDIEEINLGKNDSKTPLLQANDTKTDQFSTCDEVYETSTVETMTKEND